MKIFHDTELLSQDINRKVNILKKGVNKKFKKKSQCTAKKIIKNVYTIPGKLIFVRRLRCKKI